MSRKNIGTNYVHKLWTEIYMNKLYNTRTKVVSISYEKKENIKKSYEDNLWTNIMKRNCSINLK